MRSRRKQSSSTTVSLSCHADVPGRHGKLGEAAAKVLFQLRELAVGKPAPEIDGPDVNGKNFRLSDYRGKVIVLSFSSNLCGSATYAHQRALVERMKGAAIRDVERHHRRRNGNGEKVARRRRNYMAVLVGRRRTSTELRPLATGVVPDDLCSRRPGHHPSQGTSAERRSTWLSIGS